MDAHRLARPGLGAQVLAEAARVARDELVGGVEDVAVRAVVALELDHRADAVFALERRHVADLRAAKRVDALVVVADAEQCAAVLGRAGEHLQPDVLQAIGVLELVDQDVAEAPLVVLAQRRVVAQELVRAKHQLGEVDDAFPLALRVVGFVDLRQDAALLVLHLDVLGPQAVVLGAGDRPRQLLRRMALLVEVHRLDDALDGRELVARIEDLEALRQRGELPVRAQEPVAQAVEGADPHAAHGNREHRVEPRQHLLGGLVGERHRHHAAGRKLAGLDQPGDPRRQDAGLARARAGEDERRLGRQRDGGELLGIEALEQARRAVDDRGVTHLSILGGGSCPLP